MTLADPTQPPPPPGSTPAPPPPPPGYAVVPPPGAHGYDHPVPVGPLTMDKNTTIELQAFLGRPARAVRVMAAAPFGWWAAILLALVALVDRVEQTILSGALPEIVTEFSLSNAAAGLLTTGTAIAGAVLLFIVARLASQVNRARFLVWVLLAWSLITIGSGLAQTYAMLLALRILLGAAGAFNNPLAGSLIGDYYPRAGRSRAFGADRLAFYLGGPIGIALGAQVAGNFGWRTAFFVMAIPGLIVALLMLTLREPVRGVSDQIDVVRASSDPRIAEKLRRDAEKLDKDDALQKFKVFDPEIWADFKELLSVRTLRIVYTSLAVLFFGLGGLFALTPLMFTRDYGVSTEDAGSLAAAIGGTAVLVGFLIGFLLGDRYQGIIRGWRVVISGVGLSIGAAATTVFGLGLALPITLVAWAVLNIGFSLAIPSLTAAASDLCGARKRGQAFALYALVTAGSSALGPFLIGVIGDVIGSLQTAFLTTAPLLVVAAVIAFRARSTYDADADASLRDVVEA